MFSDIVLLGGRLAATKSSGLSMAVERLCWSGSTCSNFCSGQTRLTRSTPESTQVNSRSAGQQQ
ncbi:hypothetical protein Hdeb2414_s0008g00285801 [Helianthus debilis subsp. tardiflorus]